jgi:hypothetical protein
MDVAHFIFEEIMIVEIEETEDGEKNFRSPSLDEDE